MPGCFCVFVQFFLSFCHCFTAAVQKCNCEECSADRCSCFVLTFHCAVSSRFHSRVKFTVCTVHLKQTFFSDTGAGDCQMRTRPALRISLLHLLQQNHHRWDFWWLMIGSCGKVLEPWTHVTSVYMKLMSWDMIHLLFLYNMGSAWHDIIICTKSQYIPVLLHYGAIH